MFFFTLECKCNNFSYKITRDIIEKNINRLAANREHKHKCLDVKRSRNTARICDHRHWIFSSSRCYRTHAWREASMLVFTCETELLCICSNCVVFVGLKRTTRYRLANLEFVNKSHAVEPQIPQVPFQMWNFVYLRLFSLKEFRYSQVSFSFANRDLCTFRDSGRLAGISLIETECRRNLQRFCQWIKKWMSN